MDKLIATVEHLIRMFTPLVEKLIVDGQPQPSAAAAAATASSTPGATTPQIQPGHAQAVAEQPHRVAPGAGVDTATQTPTRTAPSATATQHVACETTTASLDENPSSAKNTTLQLELVHVEHVEEIARVDVKTQTVERTTRTLGTNTRPNVRRNFTLAREITPGDIVDIIEELVNSSRALYIVEDIIRAIAFGNLNVVESARGMTLSECEAWMGEDEPPGLEDDDDEGQDDEPFRLRHVWIEDAFDDAQDA